MTENIENIDLSLAENPEIALKMHEICIEIFGGSAGVRDKNLLESALNRGVMRVCYEPGCGAVDAVCSIAYGLAKNHPFEDGNKRTAALFMLTQLELNGYVPKDENEGVSKFADGASSEKGLTKFFEGVAAGEISEAQMIDYVKNNFKHVDRKECRSPFFNKIVSGMRSAVHAIIMFFGL